MVRASVSGILTLWRRDGPAVPKRKSGQARAVQEPIQRSHSSTAARGPARHPGHVRSRPDRTRRPRMDARSVAAIFTGMSEVTRILSAIEQGDPHAAAQLLPLVYDE